MTRTFEDRPAVRDRTPLFVGLVGPSGSGKTFSGLRLATGFQRVTGGDIYMIDTEASRGLHYAEMFRYRHLPFGAPFSPDDYLAALQHCVSKGAKNILVDSMSHEHEGAGGVLEMHEAEVERRSKGGDDKKAERVKMTAWIKPKAARRKLINGMLQMNCNIICCFRAKEKLKIVPGKDPEKLGWQPIAGPEFIYEMTLKCLLLEGANGVPTWTSEFSGERAMMKLPEQFRGLFTPPSVEPGAPAPRPPQLTEALGVELATWAAGVAAPVRMSAAELVTALDAADRTSLAKLEGSTRIGWSTFTSEDKDAVRAAVDKAKARVEKPAA